jgi:transcriptional regulator with XRE-family HTH domain
VSSSKKTKTTNKITVNDKLSLVVGERLRELRRRQNLSQLDVAQMLGISQPGYVRYEQGTTVPPTGKLLQLATIFSVTMDSLVRGNLSPGVYPVGESDIAASTRSSCIAEFNVALAKAGSDLMKLDKLRQALHRVSANL